MGIPHLGATSRAGWCEVQILDMGADRHSGMHRTLFNHIWIQFTRHRTERHVPIIQKYRQGKSRQHELH